MKNKILLMSVDFFEQTERKYVDGFINKIVELKFGIIFYARDSKRLVPYQSYMETYPNNIKLGTRNRVKEFIKTRDKSKFLVIGSKDQDFFMSNHNKLILLVPTWYDNIEEKAAKYGLQIENINQLIIFVNAIINQNNWFSIIALDDDTHIISLTDARSKYCSQSLEEKEIIEIFHNILKKGKLNYYEIYLYHFLASISNTHSIFNDINIWGIFPSSSGRLDNNEMFNFKEQVRYFMNGKVPHSQKSYIDYPNILVRHTATTKSHYNSDENRIKIGSARHFKTICLNNAYKNKLLGKNVCIFDDYLTHGNSFECARNLLKAAGVNKIIFVTLGTFRRNYQYQNYNFTGDLFSKNYDFKLANKRVISRDEFEINNAAKDEVENLHNIFNL